MRIEYAIFATSAVIREADGLFSMLDGGIVRLHAREFPANCRNLALLVRLYLESGESEMQHRCVAKAFGPDGNQVFPDLMVQIRTISAKPNWFTAHFLFDGFPLEKPGEYVF